MSRHADEATHARFDDHGNLCLSERRGRPEIEKIPRIVKEAADRGRARPEGAGSSGYFSLDRNN
ncbi:hypothetical protein GD416_21465 [Burkholderia sp. BE24]|nr:hypothetical protein [Burkholderia sp. BE24]